MGVGRRQGVNHDARVWRKNHNPRRGAATSFAGAKGASPGRPLHYSPFASFVPAYAGKRHLEQNRLYIPLKLPLDSARHTPGTAHGYSFSCLNAE